METHKDGNIVFSSGDEMRQRGENQGRQAGAQWFSRRIFELGRRR